MAKTALAMKLALRATLSLAVGWGAGVNLAPADAATVVTPDVYESSEAPDASSSSWSSQFRAMFISGSSQFSELPPGGAQLTEIALRPDQAELVGQLLRFGQLQLSVSITDVDPADISFVYDDNLTGASHVVYDGPWNTMVVNEQPSDSSTRPFDLRVALDTPFFYDPADGNLVVDWLMLTPTSPQARFDLRLESAVEGQAGVRGSSDLELASSGPFNVVHQFAFAPDLTGDVNLDDVVNLDDYEIIKDNFGRTSAVRSDGDLSCDETVSLLDFHIWKLNHEDKSSVPQATVPEPAAGALALPGVLILCIYRIRQRLFVIAQGAKS